MTIGFFAMKEQYFATFYVIFVSSYLGFWLILGCIIHISVTDKFKTLFDFLIIIPSKGGDPKVILSGGIEYKKAGEGRPQEYTVCDTKPNDMHIPSGLVYNAIETNKKLQLREIDVINQTGNKIYIRGYLEYDESTKTYHNQLDLSSLPAQMSLLSLELKTMVQTNEGLERMYEQGVTKLFKERVSSLEGQGVLTTLLVKTLEESNVSTGKFSGTNTNLENRKVDQKIGSDAKVKAIIDEKLKDVQEKLTAQLLASKGS
jgi:hypothetical protein